MIIRALKHDEVDLCRMLRLRALADAPDAFGDNYSSAVKRDSVYWTTFIQSLTPPNKQRMFLAQVGETYCGSAFAMLDRDHQGIGRVGGMWVDSKFRRQGIG